MTNKDSSTVKSFGQALTRSHDKICDIPMSQLTRLRIKGDELEISIPKDEYIARLEGCKTHFYGRFLLVKGENLIKIDAL